ncbi:hypothetical protein T5B8_01270 [Salinisphaera sp. T5B8]|uniref:DUF2938 domain-containing protein n=1 Tax=Salinisphaera sp. T5B8 TaxID=1304154 RepID=UPI0033427030
MKILLLTLVTGLGATVAMDAWGLLGKLLFGLSAPRFDWVGRWLGHMRHGRFWHIRIADAAPIRGEQALGWTAHYLIGILFAGLLPLLAGPGWLDRPTLGPALLIGVATVAAPFLIMQPAMGAGLAARHTAHPGNARWQSLLNHTVFGIGLFVSAWIAKTLTGY